MEQATRELTETERTVITGALRVAVEQYRKDAANQDVIACGGLVDQFEQQAYAADYLMGMLEDVESITIKAAA